jgi:hypothetical protein
MDEMAKCEGSTLQINRPTLEEELRQKEERLEQQLKDVKELQSLLAGNPAIAQFQNLVMRVRHI